MDKRLTALPLLLLLATACASGGGSTRSLTDLANPSLGPEFSVWLAGAASRIATPEEIRQYLALRDDAAARSFVETFWERRDPAPDKPGNPLRETFEQRSAAADRSYGEAGVLGRRTDRGAVFVLYGPPTKTDFEVPPTPEDSPVEVWIYDASAPSGLDARRPAGRYRFIKRGDFTVTYLPTQQRRAVPGIPPQNRRF